MLLSEFIRRLKNFPEDDEFKFYCPTNQKYYYIKSTQIGSKRAIILTDDIKHKLYFMTTYKDVINILDTFFDIEIKFLVNDQEFKIQ